MSHKDARILYKLTTRSRPHRAFEVIQSVFNHLNNPNYYIMVSIDSDDPTLQTLKDLCVGLNVNFYEGTSKNKIDAINRDIDLYPFWDILVNLSDDTKIIRIGFDDIIREVMYREFPGMDGVIHVPDGNRRDLMTVSILGRNYYLKDNYIYWKEYKNLWCDNEALEVSRMRNKYYFLDEEILVHEHPAYNKIEFDEQYRKSESSFGSDQDTFNRRKQINFNIS